MSNTILWGDAPDELSGDGTLTQSHCHVQDGSTPDPRFASTDPDDPKNLRLLEGSPCIDAGDASVAPESDIDGRGRHDQPDLGAREWWPGDR